jgi:hypothetical protein
VLVSELVLLIGIDVWYLSSIVVGSIDDSSISLFVYSEDNVEVCSIELEMYLIVEESVGVIVLVS